MFVARKKVRYLIILIDNFNAASNSFSRAK
ncbi:hypothetical protein X564_19030 [Pseudoalteromonas agarivorans]|nr:hypothetical protein X564_19030 [Pseudoalteromonas agarivorans]